MPGFDLKQVSRNDQLIVGGGVVAFIASFLPYVGVSYHFGGIHESASVDAWRSFALLGLLFIFVAAILVALRVFAKMAMPALPVGINVLIAGLAALGTVLVFLRAVSYSHVSVEWGGWLLIIAGIVETVGAVMNFKSSGEKLAWDPTAMNRGTATAPVTPYPPQGAAPTEPSVYPPADPGAPSA